MARIRGFTLIELMIVIAILGILLAIAIPAYGDFSIRAKVSEGIYLSATAKSSVSEYRAANGRYPADNAEAGLPDVLESSYVESVEVADGVITITYRNIDAAVDGSQLALTPTWGANMGALTWSCKPAAANGVSERYIPQKCR